MAREFQAFYASSTSVSDSSRALSLGLTILKEDSDEELANHISTYLDLLNKTFDVRTNKEFLSFVEQKHVTARDAMVTICKSEGISIQ